jgi:hypothetical protein
MDTSIIVYGLPAGTRTPIARLGGRCSIQLSYGEAELE